VAHGNTLRSIIKVLDGITDKGIAVFYKDILELNIPTATPIMYEFDRSLNVLSKRYLGNAEEIRRKAE
jgi:2,3-bisphosphoglycerate-dependent phosphoglycerate mutase